MRQGHQIKADFDASGETDFDSWFARQLESGPGRQMLVSSRGVGDTLAKLTSTVGIKPCGGCKKRQAWLNKLLPYKTKAL